MKDENGVYGFHFSVTLIKQVSSVSNNVLNEKRDV